MMILNDLSSLLILAVRQLVVGSAYPGPSTQLCLNNTLRCPLKRRRLLSSLVTTLPRLATSPPVEPDPRMILEGHNPAYNKA